ncbi:MAG: hypothetical protein D4R55_00470 [Chitinophagaceae bacterium]|nr:MAG: hypothetical protein D4R55_00470 [Chitinophagaceae bacterium]
MKKFLKLSFTAVIAILAVTSISSCKKNFDEPPAYIDPNMVANTSIKALKALHTSGGFEAISGDVIISGTVVADDKSGNFYKELYIQDASGAVAIALDGTNLYTAYPIGRKLYIKCKGLYLSDYGGMIQIGVIDRSVPGNSTLAGIPSSLFDTYVVKGSSNNPVTPRVVTQSQLTTNIQDTLLGTLIQLNGYQFSTSDLNGTYADTSAAKNSINLNLKDCSANAIILRSSGYANFAGMHPAQGKGNITAIYTIFNSTKQLIIRDTSDVQFYGQRCNLFEEDFSSLVTANNNTVFNFPGWKNIGEVGGVTFSNGVFGASGKVVKVSGFGSGQNVVTSWLITPPIALPAGSTPKLSFTTSDAFDNGATLKAFISTNYNGGATPSTATWIQLPASISSGHTTSTFGPFMSSGLLSLSAYAGQTVYISWRYDGADPTGTASDKTTTIEVDDIAVSRQ